MSNKGHSETGASGMYRWGECPGSVALSRKVIEGSPGKAAEQGTAAHEVLELCELGAKAEPADFIGDEMSNGYKFTEGDASAVEDAIECLKKRSGSIKVAHSIDFEVEFDLTSLCDGLWGTSDVVMAADDMSVLYVDDYKHGIRQVNPEDNYQLLFYALGAIRKYCEDHGLLDLLEMSGYGGVFKRVEVGIIQPRCQVNGETHRTWIVPDGLLEAFSVVLVVKAEATREPDAPRIAGTHCDWCRAKPICKEFNNKAQQLAKIDFAPTVDPKTITLPNPAEMSMDDILALKDFQPLFKAYFESIDSYLLGQLKSGADVPGHKLVRGVKHRAWQNFEEFVENNALLVDEDKLYKKKPITPKQAEALVGKDLVAEYCFMPEGPLQVAPSGDKRKAVAISAKDDFTKTD